VSIKLMKIGIQEQNILLSRNRNRFMEPVSRTLKNPRFCRVFGTGSGKNPKFEKGSGPTGTGTGSGTLKNPRFCRVLGIGSGRKPLKKGSRTGSWEH
jgi:hypothetical protein